uniref:Transmembrane p24 trafficking protein 4 n=1 Tax=Molossus molossus TaxID=27622 RepID=A0A7J8HEE0_MOLMO|nr:transmembrane p24 trafficking protein 4 [Molossus molossus]
MRRPALLLLALCAVGVRGLYFHIGETEKRCFIEEIPDETMVIGNYPEIAAKDKLTELQLRARQLLDQVEQIQKEQDYQRYREERFRLTSESTNQRVLWWSITQTVILILTGIWQMRHLKSFFEAKKLV